MKPTISLYSAKYRFRRSAFRILQIPAVRIPPFRVLQIPRFTDSVPFRVLQIPFHSAEYRRPIFIILSNSIYNPNLFYSLFSIHGVTLRSWVRTDLTGHDYLIRLVSVYPRSEHDFLLLDVTDE